ncbi:MAG: High-affinity nickel-transporter [Nocardiopsaceae bacterium]|jgi:ABC-type nickel/cobalt efflux system permease component RcnA|nr:High-affinity nickel-transporter [Nocardiopsaceae bacterium]
MKRLVSLGLLTLGVVGLVLALPGKSAWARPAHPLGNFSVNQALAVNLYPNRIAVAAIVDLAELPTLQARSTVDVNGDGDVSGAESAAYNGRVCHALAGQVAVKVDGHRVRWSVRGDGFEYRHGSAGLHTSRISCALAAPASLRSPAVVDVVDAYQADRVGWREITAAGHGVHIRNSPVPARSISHSLRSYPTDLLGSPLNQRSARLQVEPGGGHGAGAAAIHVSGGDPVSRWVAAADRKLEALVGGHLTPLIGVLAVLLALMLGAAHAALPGHGKTVMAAYIAGRRGRPRDALTVGAVVTLTHTGGVLVLGLLLTAGVSLAGEVVLSWLGIASGILVAAVGITMLTGVIRRRASVHDHGHGHSHDHSGHDRGHDHGPAGHTHHHLSRRPRQFSLVGMGIAGGLVPSPSALIVLLGAVGLGRTAFGVLLVIAYGAGMAAALTAAGLVLVRVRDRWASRPRRTLTRVAALAPAGTAVLVLCVGIGLAGRAALTVIH